MSRPWITRFSSWLVPGRRMIGSGGRGASICHATFRGNTTLPFRTINEITPPLLEISNRTSQPPREQHDGCGIEEGSSRGDGCLEVFRQTAIAPEPGEEALDHPAAGMDGKADLAGLLADDLDDDAGRVRHALGGVGAIGEHPLDEWQQPARCPQQRDGTVAILHRGRMDLEHQSRPSVSTMA